MAKKTKTLKVKKESTIKSVTQKEIAREIFRNLNGEITLADIEKIISMEQQLNLKYLKLGFSLTKRDYFTYISKMIEAKEWTSPLNGKKYLIPKHYEVIVRAGEGLKKALMVGGEIKCLE